MSRQKWRVAAFAACAIAGIALLLLWRWSHTNELLNEAKQVEVSQVKLLMTRMEVEKLHGKGEDKTPGCFGCEMNFIYPELHLSGRYSETLDRMKKGEIDHQESPKVKQITTSDPTFSAFGIRIGDKMKLAGSTLESRGFVRQSDPSDNYYLYYSKDDLYIRLWNDPDIHLMKKDRTSWGEEDDPVASITIEIRVAKDEEILY